MSASTPTQLSNAQGIEKIYVYLEINSNRQHVFAETTFYSGYSTDLTMSIFNWNYHLESGVAVYFLNISINLIIDLGKQ